MLLPVLSTIAYKSEVLTPSFLGLTNLLEWLITQRKITNLEQKILLKNSQWKKGTGQGMAVTRSSPCLCRSHSPSSSKCSPTWKLPKPCFMEVSLHNHHWFYWQLTPDPLLSLAIWGWNWKLLLLGRSPFQRCFQKSPTHSATEKCVPQTPLSGWHSATPRFGELWARNCERRPNIYFLKMILQCHLPSVVLLSWL